MIIATLEDSPIPTITNPIKQNIKIMVTGRIGMKFKMLYAYFTASLADITTVAI